MIELMVSNWVWVIVGVVSVGLVIGGVGVASFIKHAGDDEKQIY